LINRIQTELASEQTLVYTLGYIILEIRSYCHNQGNVIQRKTTICTHDSQREKETNMFVNYWIATTLNDINRLFQAVAAVETATDRLCIASKGKIQAHLSEEQIISCCTICGSG